MESDSVCRRAALTRKSHRQDMRLIRENVRSINFLALGQTLFHQNINIFPQITTRPWEIAMIAGDSGLAWRSSSAIIR